MLNDFFNRVIVCREDDPQDVDEAYGPGTYERLFPPEKDVEDE